MLKDNPELSVVIETTRAVLTRTDDAGGILETGASIAA